MFLLERMLTSYEANDLILSLKNNKMESFKRSDWLSRNGSTYKVLIYESDSKKALIVLETFTLLYLHGNCRY